MYMYTHMILRIVLLQRHYKIYAIDMNKHKKTPSTNNSRTVQTHENKYDSAIAILRTLI